MAFLAEQVSTVKAYRAHCLTASQYSGKALLVTVLKHVYTFTPEHLSKFSGRGWFPPAFLNLLQQLERDYFPSEINSPPPARTKFSGVVGFRPFSPRSVP